MVQLRVDVEAARARQEFDRAARAVDNLGDQLTQAEIDAVRLEDAMDDTAREAARLRAEVNRLGSSAPQQLRDDLLAAERAAVQARIAFQRADAEVDQLENSLGDARREAERLRREMDRLDADAGSGRRRLQRSLIGQRDEWRNAGREAVQAFGGGFSALPIEIKAAAGVAAAGVAAMLGGAIGGAITAGVGGGVMAVAIKKAMVESNVAQQAWRDNLAPMRKEITELALGYEDELVRSAFVFGEAWDRVSDDVGSAFRKMEAYVEPLADGLAELGVNAFGGDGFSDLIEAAGPVLDELARSLPMVGTALNDMFQSIADGEGNVKGMRALMLLLAGSLRFAGEAIEFLSDGFDLGTRAAEKFFTIASKIPVIGGLFDDAAESWKSFNDPAQGYVKAMESAGPAGEEAAEGIYQTAEAAKEASREAKKLNDELNEFIDQALAASGASIAYERAIDDLSDSFKENGRSIDITAEAGRKNVEAVNEAIDAAQRKMQSDIEAAGGEKASKEAIDAATAAYRNKIGEIERNLRALGLNQQQIDALLGKYKNFAALPNITKTVTLKVGTQISAGAASMAAAMAGVQPRASGGPILPGQPYLVGEDGPELIVPERAGMVVNAAGTARMMGGGGTPLSAAAAGVPTLNLINNGGSNDWLGQALAYAIRTGIVRLVVVNGEVRVG